MNKLIKNIFFSGTSVALLVALVTTLSSCHKEVSSSNQIGTSYTISYSQIFEDFWNNMNKTYVFWSVDSTNWDRMHTIYAPKFAALDYDSTISNDSISYLAAVYFYRMTKGLTDSHYTLSLNYSGYTIDPALDRKWNNPQFIANLFSDTQLYPDYTTNNYYTLAVDTQPKYLSLANRVIGIDSGLSSILPYKQYLKPSEFYAVSGYITNTNILYFTFSGFSLLSILSDADSASFQAQAAILNFLNQLNNPNLSGVIIDVRGNGGGETADLNFLVGRLISNQIKVGYTRSKNGNGRLDYTPWADAIVSPWAAGTAQKYGLPPVTPFTKPIVVLADGLSASMSELTTMSLKTLPTTIFVGDTTWGANGPLTQNQDYNTGSFNFGNYQNAIETGTPYYYGQVYTSSCMFKYINGKIYEGRGFPPDYDVKVTPSQLFLANNKVDDPQLDKAISLLPH